MNVGKGTNKKGKKVAVPKANIQELNASRDGGQIALRGYSYQFLYSCYLILESARISFFSSVSTILNSSLKSGNLLVATPIPLYYFLVTAFSSSRTAFSFYNIYHGVCIPGNDIQSILISLILFIGLSGIAILFILFFSKREKNDNR